VQLLCPILTLYLVAVFGRIVLSWFPVTPGSFMSSVFTFLYSITEPVLGPLRRAIPSIGMFDLSPLVVVFGISIIQQSIGCGRLF
jgi:YggT family protein